MTRITPGTNPWFDEMDIVLDGIEAKADSALDSTPISVKSHGAVGDGATNDAAAFNAAIAEAVTLGRSVWVPAGVYLINSALTAVTQPITIEGESRDGAVAKGAVIHFASGSTTFFTSSATVTIRNLAILGVVSVGSVTTSKAIRLTGGAYSLIENCLIAGFGTNLELSGAVAALIQNNAFISAKVWNIFIENTASPDAGDHTISGNVFDTDYAGGWVAAAAIRIESSGGSKITTNKFLRHLRQVDVAPADGATVTVLTVTGNSFQQGSGGEQLRIQAKATTGVYYDCTVSGNEFSMQAGGGTGPANILVGSGGADVVITGNILMGPNTAGGAGIKVSGTGLAVTIVGNVFATWPTGIDLSGSTTGGEASIGQNHFRTAMVMVKEAAAITTSAYQRPHVEHTYRKPFVSLTGSGYTNLFQIDCVDLYNGFEIDVVCAGLAGSVGAFSSKRVRLAARDTGAVALTTVGTDTDGGSGATGIDINFDVTTTSGSVIVQVRKGGGASAIAGSLTLRVRGNPVSVTQL